MRTDGVFGRRLANRDWLPSTDRFPAGIEIDTQQSDSEPQERVRERQPLDRTGVTVAPQTLDRVPGVETRPPAHEVWYLVRPFGAWSGEWTGQHGVIGLRGGDAGQNAGGMQAWDGQRRTLRSQPLVPWDAGTAIGPAGAGVTLQ